MNTSVQTDTIMQAPAHLEPSVELFQFFTRDFNGDTYLSELPFNWLDLVVKNSAIFVAWEIRKFIGDRWVVIAQSINWNDSVIDVMQNAMKSKRPLNDLHLSIARKISEGRKMETRATDGFSAWVVVVGGMLHFC